MHETISDYLVATGKTLEASKELLFAKEYREVVTYLEKDFLFKGVKKNYG